MPVCVIFLSELPKYSRSRRQVLPLHRQHAAPVRLRLRIARHPAGERLTRDSIPVEIRVQGEAGPKSTIQKARESAERAHILRALEESNWNVSGAARALGMERTNLHKRIRALGLTRGK